ncbi:calmodulin-A-like [Mya arenaria]|uniref:calmodulin-A-like n=1 Tax=Mya arenaria TaxID=6604 RepID=UPI0022E81782|nr:calmodulin-A-like [Mya arenaria]XP_052767260.1 calmodulin-A-like [Mya arenaria]
MPGLNLNPTQQAQLKEAFVIFDTDQDGKVDRSQATQIIRSVGISPTNDNFSDMLGQSERLFSMEDLKRVIQTKAPALETRESLLDAFRIFDKDGNGYIDAKELRHVLVHLGEKLKDDEVDEMYREVDITGDNQIMYEDIVRAIESCMN